MKQVFIKMYFGDYASALAAFPLNKELITGLVSVETHDGVEYVEFDWKLNETALLGAIREYLIKRALTFSDVELSIFDACESSMSLCLSSDHYGEAEFVRCEIEIPKSFVLPIPNVFNHQEALKSFLQLKGCDLPILISTAQNEFLFKAGQEVYIVCKKNEAQSHRQAVTYHNNGNYWNIELIPF